MSKMIFIQKTLKRQLEVFMAQFLFYYAPGDFRGAFWRELQFFFSHFQALNSRVQFSLDQWTYSHYRLGKKSHHQQNCLH